MSLKSRMLGFVTMLGMISGCGSATDTVNLKIFSNIDSPQKAVNLMQSTLDMANPAVMRDGVNGDNSRCYQQNLYAGVIATGSPENLFETYPVTIHTPRDMSAGNADMATWLSINATTSTISLPVPHNTNVDFGIVGSLVSSSTASISEKCLTVDASTQTVFGTYSVIGHQDNVNVSSGKDVSLAVMVLAFSDAPAAGCSTGGTISSSDGNCAKRNFVKINCTNCSSYTSGNYRLRLDYFAGRNRADHPSQIIPMNNLSSSGFASVPSMRRMSVTLITSLGAVVGSFDSDKNEWTNNTKTYVMPNTSASFVLSEY